MTRGVREPRCRHREPSPPNRSPDPSRRRPRRRRNAAGAAVDLGGPPAAARPRSLRGVVVPSPHSCVLHGGEEEPAVGRPTSGSFPSTRQPKPTAPPRSRTAMNWSAPSDGCRSTTGPSSCCATTLTFPTRPSRTPRVPVGTVRSRLLLRDARVARGARRRRAAGGRGGGPMKSERDATRIVQSRSKPAQPASRTVSSTRSLPSFLRGPSGDPGRRGGRPR